jgi:hypothetical protein
LKEVENLEKTPPHSIARHFPCVKQQIFIFSYFLKRLIIKLDISKIKKAYIQVVLDLSPSKEKFLKRK